MILSASRRTDIPAFYMDWLLKRLQEGYVLVRNPRNAQQISRISLLPDVLDGIVFWSKHPAQLMACLPELQRVAFYVQYTLTPYGQDLELGLPAQAERLRLFQQLSAALGPERVVWRYDPILCNAHYTQAFHIRAFQTLAEQLHRYTDSCVISFVDTHYRGVKRNAGEMGLTELPVQTRAYLCGAFAEIARGYGLQLSSCAQRLEGIAPARCVDTGRLERQLGFALHSKRAGGQRPDCGCAESIDIGVYNSCQNGCKYCYANYYSGT